jgi:hypothetical protein
MARTCSNRNPLDNVARDLFIAAVVETLNIFERRILLKQVSDSGRTTSSVRKVQIAPCGGMCQKTGLGSSHYEPLDRREDHEVSMLALHQNCIV